MLPRIDPAVTIGHNAGAIRTTGRIGDPDLIDERNVIMVGTLLNAMGIAIGAMAGAIRKKPLPEADQAFLKLALGVAAVAVGLRVIWISVDGGPGRILKQLIIVVLALTIGKLLGRLLRLQNLSNRLGQYANRRMQTGDQAPNRSSEGFVICSILFCVAPLAIVGAVHDGLRGFYLTLALKAAMDGLTVMSFVPAFGQGVVLSVLPVVAYQGAITLCARLLLPFLQTHGLADSITATGGFLVFCVALIIFQVKKIELTNYLPSLAVAPLLAWLMNW